jgi:Uma2 family endonuclease
MVSLTRNDYEPDVCFFGNDKAKNFTPKQAQFPAPDFIVKCYPTRLQRMTVKRKFQIMRRTA